MQEAIELTEAQRIIINLFSVPTDENAATHRIPSLIILDYLKWINNECLLSQHEIAVALHNLGFKNVAMRLPQFNNCPIICWEVHFNSEVKSEYLSQYEVKNRINKP